MEETISFDFVLFIECIRSDQMSLCRGYRMKSVLNSTLTRVSLKLLIVEDNIDEAELIVELLSDDSVFSPISCCHVERLSHALLKIDQEKFDAILLDLSLPDSSGIYTISQFHCQCENIPIIVLTGTNQQELALQAIGAGAQDYLYKGNLTTELLIRSIRYAIERQQSQEALRQSEAKYRSVINQVKEVIFQTDAAGNWCFLNAAWTEITGFSVEESLGRPFFEYLHPQDRPVCLEKFKQMMSELPPEFQETTRYITKNGQVRWLEIHGQLIFHSPGNCQGITGIIKDITEHKLAQEALKSSEAIWRSYVENSLVGIAITAPDQTWIEVNDAFCQLFGYSKQELLEKNWSDLTHPEDTVLDFEVLYKILTGEINSYVLDKRFIHQEGHIIYARLSVRCIRRPDQSIDHLIIMILDLSDRYYYEEKLKASQEFLHHALNAIADPIFVKDEQHRWLILNDAYCQLVGKSREELISKSDYDVFPPEEAVIFWEKDQQVFDTNQENENEEILTDIQGSQHIISTKKTIFTTETEEKILVGTIRDITKLKEQEQALRQSEERYALATAGGQVGVWDWNLQTQEFYIAPNLKKMLGYEDHEISNHLESWLSLVHPDDQAALQEATTAHLQGLTPIYEFEHRMIHKDGTIRWILVRGIAYRDPEGKPYRMAGSDTDITKLKQTELAMRQSQARLAEAQKVAHVGDWQFDLQTKEVIWSEELCRILGVEPKPTTFSYETYLEKVHPDDRATLETAFNLAITQNQSYEFDQRIWSVDGSLRYLMCKGKPIFNAEGQVIQLFGTALDITERIQVENALRQSQERLQLALEGSALGLWDWQIGTNDIYLSPQWKTMLGYEEDEIEDSISFWERLLHPEDLSKAWEEIGLYLEGHTDIYEAEYRMRSKSGEWKWIMSRGKIFEWDESGKPIRMTGTHKDISDRKQAEQVLRRQALMFETISDGVILMNLEGEILDWNPAAERMFGYAKETVLGQHLSQLGLPLYGIDLNRNTPILAPWQGEIEFTRPDLSLGVSETVIVPLRDKNGEPVAILSVNRDITERKQYEIALEQERQQLRQIVTHAPVAMAMFDQQMRYLAHSNQWRTDYHLTGQLLLGKSHYDLFPELSEEWKAIYQRALSGEIISIPEDCWHYSPGSQVYFRHAIHPWYTPEGTVAGIVIASDRINELVEARETALEAARFKSQFLANMSHEIRTPMNGVLGMTDLLLTTGLNPQQEDFVKTLKVSGEQLLTLINDILDFSKLEAAEMRLDRQEFDLQICLEEVINLLAFSAAAKGLELVLLMDPLVSRYIIGDPSRLRQILTNLVGNAIKFTHQGEVVIQVTLAGCQQFPWQNPQHPTPLTHQNLQQTIIRFAIRDTGIGLSEVDQKKLFQPFSQIDTSTTRKYGGTGLGLAICKQLVELMGGQIGVESQINRGSTFWFSIPFDVAESAATRSSLLTQFHRTLHGKKLLVADTNQTNRQVVRLLATLWGMQVEEADNGINSLTRICAALAQGNPYDLVLLDWQLPRMESDILGQLVRLQPALGKTKLILMISVNQTEKAKNLLDFGFTDYLVKPIRESKLLEIFLQVMGEKSPAGFASVEGSLVSRDILELSLEMPEIERMIGDLGRETLDQMPTNSPINVPETLQNLRCVSQQNQLSQGKILLVEDTPINQKVVLNQLEMLNYQAYCVNNGQEAVDQLMKEHYDMVLMDCQMPVLDGYQATHKIREREKNLAQPPVIIIGLTANALKGDREKCLEAGMDDYLSKPVVLRQLEEMLTQWRSTIQRRDKASQQQESVGVNLETYSGMEVVSGTLALPGIETLLDYPRLYELSQGDLEFEQELLQTFLEDAYSYLEDMKTGLDQGNLTLVGRRAHQLKGGSATIGVLQLPQLALTVEKHLEQQPLPVVNPLLEKIEEILHQLKLIIEH